MGIFQHSRQNRVSLSEDWKAFMGHFRNIGAFTYKKSVQTAYFDDNARRILQTEPELSQKAYNELMQRITAEPAENEQNLYIFRTGAEKHTIRLHRTPTGDGELGFVEENARSGQARSPREQQEYDEATGLLLFPVFTGKIRRKMQTAASLHIAALHVEGLDKTAGFIAVNGAAYCMASVAGVLERFAGSRVLLAVKSFQNFYVCFEDMDAQSVRMVLDQMRTAVAGCTITDDFGQPISQENAVPLELRIGLAVFPDEGDSLTRLLSYAEFALFETRHDSRNPINRFSPADYQRKKDEYREQQLFSAVLEQKENIAYHFQPIVDARTGRVAAYEALMRPEHFTPERILSLAEHSGRLYEIEHATIFNCMKFLSEHQNAFSQRKLFINSIPSCLLSESDFNTLLLTYEGLFEKVVIEIIEQTEENDDSQRLLQERCRTTSAQIAIDDYGSGYANTVTLLRNVPHFLKVDRCLIDGICKDPKKQQLVASVIDYAHNNQITVIAMGIEEEDDMRTLIRMGADMLQGYYLSRPKAFLMEEIPKEIRDAIVETNLKTVSGQRKIYNAHNDEKLDLVELALQHYTDLHIYRHKLTLVGDPAKTVRMHIAVMDNHSCELTLQNVNIKAGDKPAVSIGSYAQLTLQLKGSNSLDYMGIRVPQGAFFKLTGDGDLKIDSYARFGYGIGGDCDSSYGSISMCSTGKVEIICNSDRGVGIGGGSNPDDSEISLDAGSVHIDVGSPNALGIGCMNGNSIIYASAPCDLALDINGISSVGMGSLTGETHIQTSCGICFHGGGSRMVGIGVLNQGTGEVLVENADLKFYMRSSFGTCIGAIGGDVDVTARNCKVEVNAEGGEITGIGDAKGSGDVTLDRTELKALILAGKPHEAGSRSGQLSMHSSTIIADINDKHNTKE